MVWSSGLVMVLSGLDWSGHINIWSGLVMLSGMVVLCDLTQPSGQIIWSGGVIWSGLVWSGLVRSGLVWFGHPAWSGPVRYSLVIWSSGLVLSSLFIWLSCLVRSDHLAWLSGLFVLCDPAI